MSEQEALRRRISAVQFAAWELHLFLDSHPNMNFALEISNISSLASCKVLGSDKSRN